jgi:Zn-dependent peptidase ImmA (M78 family)
MWRYDQHGRPVLRDPEIEDEAYRLLQEVDRSALAIPCRAPIAKLLDYLHSTHDVKIVFAKIGEDGARTRIVGKTVFSQNSIWIDEDVLDDEPLFLSTAAHEIGHWTLHRHKKMVKDDSRDEIDNLEDDESSLNVWRRRRLETTQDWIEHQAKVFAGALLMPGEAFTRAVIEAQRKMGVTRQLGIIIRDNQRSSERDLQKIVADLQGVFGTSKESIRVRLSACGILQDKSGLQHISNAFRSLASRKPGDN